MIGIHNVNILVCGDLMLDKYTQCNVDRISPEAPVPVCQVTNEYTTLGGCGNVVNNLHSIGANVSCFASIADDIYGQNIKEHLKNIGAKDLTFTASKVTTVKERIVAGETQTQMLRVDREVIQSLAPEDYSKYLRIMDYDVVIISDYAKGVVNNNLIDYIKQTNTYKRKVIIDPKPKNISLYNYLCPFMITPNEKEFNEIKENNKDIFSEYILETKGRHGMKLFLYDREVDIPGHEVKISNVSGAGDTVISVVSACIAMGMDPLFSARVANKCAAYVVTQPGTTPIPKDKFFEYLQETTKEYNDLK